jgi:hypothetical protein
MKIRRWIRITDETKPNPEKFPILANVFLCMQTIMCATCLTTSNLTSIGSESHTDDSGMPCNTEFRIEEIKHNREEDEYNALEALSSE